MAHLLGTYPTPVSRAVGSSCEGSHRDGSNVDLSNLLTNHDFQYQLWQKQQQQQQQHGQNSGGNAPWGESWGVSATTATKMSVDDAFGDLPDVEDLPLPSLKYMVSEDNIEVDEGNKVDEGNDQMMRNEVDEFGDFDGGSLQTSMAEDKKPQPGTENPILGTMNNGEILTEDFDGAYPPFPSSDGIGVSEGSAVAGIEVCVEISDNEFSDFNAAPDTALVYVSGDQSLSEFDNVNSAHLSMMVQHGPTLSISDAFEPLVVEQEAQSELLVEEDTFGGCEITDNEADEQDAFGGFKSTLSQPKDDDKIVDKDKGDEFGSFESKFTQVEGTMNHQGEGGKEFYSETDCNPSIPDALPNDNHSSQVGSFSGMQLHQLCTHHATLSITDAFDSLVSEQEVVPVLFAPESNNSTIASLPNQAHITSDINSENRNDEFGGFESDEVSSPENQDPNDETVTGLQNTVPNKQEQFSESRTSDHVHSPTPQHGNHVPTLSISDAFASLIGDQESSLAPDNNFAFVESSGHTTEESHGISSGIARREGSSDGTQVSIFDEKKTNDDDNVKPESKSEQIPVINKEMSLSIQENTEVGIQSTGLSAFDDVFGGIQDAPLPPLEAFSPTFDEREKSDVVEMSEFDESFGDFEGNAAVGRITPEGELVEKSAFADAVVGNFECTPQAPMMQDLPHQLLVGGVSSDPHTLFQPIEAFPQEAKERGQSHMDDAPEFDDSFGYFEGTSAVAVHHDRRADLSEKTTEHSFSCGNTGSNFDNFNDQNDNEADKASNYSLQANESLSRVNMDKNTNGKLDHDFIGFTTYDNLAISPAIGVPDQQACTINQHAYEDNDIEGFSPFAGAFPNEDIADLVEKTTLTHDEVAPFGGKTQPSGFQAFTNTQFEATPELSEANNADFGDFSALEPANVLQVGDRTDHNQQNHSSLSYEKPVASADLHVHNIVHTEADGDDFGDFTAFGSPDIAHTEDRTDETHDYIRGVSNNQSETAVDLHRNDIVHAEVHSDDIVGFSEFGWVDHPDKTYSFQDVTILNVQPEAPADLHVNNVLYTEADDHDLGEFSTFGSADVSHTEDRVNTKDHSIISNKHTENLVDLRVDNMVHAEADDADVGDFSAFGSADMLHTEDRVHTQENHSIMSNIRTEAAADLHIDDDDFGDFSAFESAEMLHTEDMLHTNENHLNLNKQSEAADLQVNHVILTEGDHDGYGDFSAFGSADMLSTEDRIDTHEDHSNSVTQAETAADLRVDNIDQADNFECFAAFGPTDHIQDDHDRAPSKHSEAAASLHVINLVHDGVDGHDVEDLSAFGSADAAHTQDTSNHTQDDLTNISNNQLEADADLHGNNIILSEGDGDEVGIFAGFEATDSTAMADASEAMSFDAEFGEFAAFDSAPPHDATIHVGFSDSSQSCSDLRERINALERLPSPLPSKEIIVQCFEKCRKIREVSLFLVLVGFFPHFKRSSVFPIF